MNKKFSVLIKNKVNKYNRKITVDPDKSISHRCYILASQCLGVSVIKGLNSEDIKITKCLQCFRIPSLASMFTDFSE